MAPLQFFRRVLLAAAALVLIAGTAAAQPPKRPRLEADADTNDWKAYYDYGVSQLKGRPKTAEGAFYWAARLDPTRAEPLFAGWVAFWLKNQNRFGMFLRDVPKVVEADDVKAAEALRARALEKNPFVHQGLLILPYADLPGGLSDDLITRAFVAYGEAKLELAVKLFGQAVQQKKYTHLRFIRASAFVGLRQLDSAVTEITELLNFLRAEDAREFAAFYNSKELIEYALGRLYAQRQQYALATEAFGRALAEDLSYAPAHDALGRMAQTQRDWERALAEHTLAVQLDSNDVESRLSFANALYYSRKPDEAMQHVKAAIELEPLYAESYFQLARLHDSADDRAGASAAYQKFVAIAPRSSSANLDKARERLKALGAGQ
jgi:tetratricopeptide (TPR) repeat protein